MDLIGLDEFIKKVKSELLSSKDNSDLPIFFVEKIELEIAIKIVADASGALKIYVTEVNLGGSTEKTNTIKITLTPIITIEEIRERIENNPHYKKQLFRRSNQGVLKGDFDDI
jgi:hypothetical protein